MVRGLHCGLWITIQISLFLLFWAKKESNYREKKLEREKKRKRWFGLPFPAFCLAVTVVEDHRWTWRPPSKQTQAGATIDELGKGKTKGQCIIASLGFLLSKMEKSIRRVTNYRGYEENTLAILETFCALDSSHVHDDRKFLEFVCDRVYNFSFILCFI